MFALGSGARFIARGIDVHKSLPEVLKAAHAHRGASFVEIYQNCVVYNDDVFASFTARDFAADRQLWLSAGQPMLFAGGTKGIALDVERLALKVVEGDDPAVLVHDPKNRGVAAMLIELPGRVSRSRSASSTKTPRRPSKASSSSKTPPPPARPPTSRRWSPKARAGWSKEPHKL